MQNISLYEFAITKTRTNQNSLIKEDGSYEYRGDAPEALIPLINNVIRKASWYNDDREHVCALLLNTKLDVIGVNLLSIGSVNECSIRVAEMLRPVIIANAPSFILVHNHPSGDTTPSNADIDITNRANQAAKVMGIKLLDHLIIGNELNRDKFLSFREKGIF